MCSLNHTRYQSWSQQDCKAAGYAFDGPAYKALEMRSLQDADVQFAQQHVRILDALYGILKPLDSIKPYRLEMGSKLQTQRGNNLYAFWGNALSEALNRQVLHVRRSSRVPNVSYSCCPFTFTAESWRAAHQSQLLLSTVPLRQVLSSLQQFSTDQSSTHLMYLAGMHEFDAGVLQSCSSGLTAPPCLHHVFSWACRPCQSSKVRPTSLHGVPFGNSA